jgi:two-component system, OmpR family, sensor histidine kinase BaeS
MIKIINSLLWKLILAFLLVAVTTAGLVAVFIRITSVDRLSQLIVDQQVNSLQTSLEIYYAENGSWEGITQVWQQFNPRAMPTSAADNINTGNDNHNPPPDKQQNFFSLVDSQGKVLIANNPVYMEGDSVPAQFIKDGTPILVNGKQVGAILTPPSRPHFNPEENLFLKRTTEALLYAVAGAMIVAFGLGIFLARTLIHPLQALTLAAQNIAQGKLEQAVQVKSKDEIGQLALAFNTMSREVARVNQMRRQMTADIAHDLRTPLTVIAGYVEAMRDGVLQPTSERLALIFTEIEHLQNLVNDLRFLSQADAGELPLHSQPISPKILLERAAAPFMRHAELQHVTLMVKTDDHLPEINVDEARMMQVFSNLISNALRYTPENGTIQLSAQLVKEKVMICVRDSGAGIPEEDLPLIFNRFYRVDKSRSDAGETGLGLAIVKALVEAHNGIIRVESQLDQYTAFIIEFPHN